MLQTCVRPYEPILIREHAFVNREIEQSFGIYVCFLKKNVLLLIQQIVGGIVLWHMERLVTNREKF